VGGLIWIGTAAVVVVVLLSLLLATHSGSPGTGSAAGASVAGLPVGPDIGERAPDFTLADLQGRPVSLHSFLGHPVLLHFWAVDCPTCRAEQPEYLRAIHTLGAKAPAILAVDAWGEPASYVAPYVRQAGLPGTVLIDPPHSVFDGLYQGQGTPTSFYIDARGVIRQRVIGPQSYSDILANAQLIGA
jgi:peroxiredoxin